MRKIVWALFLLASFSLPLAVGAVTEAISDSAIYLFSPPPDIEEEEDAFLLFGAFVVVNSYPIVSTPSVRRVVIINSAERKSVYDMVIKYAREAGYDENMAVNIAFCESGFNPRATSPTGAKGVFQFIASTWESTNKKMGRSGLDAYDAEANISAGIWKLVHEGDGAWRPWSGPCYLNNPLIKF